MELMCRLDISPLLAVSNLPLVYIFLHRWWTESPIYLNAAQHDRTVSPFSSQKRRPVSQRANFGVFKTNHSAAVLPVQRVIFVGANFRINYRNVPILIHSLKIFVQLSTVTQNILTVLCKEIFVSFNFCIMLFNTKISTIRKLPAIRYNVVSRLENRTTAVQIKDSGKFSKQLSRYYLWATPQTLEVHG